MNQHVHSLKEQYKQASLEADQGTLQDLERLKSLERELGKERELNSPRKSLTGHGEGET